MKIVCSFLILTLLLSCDESGISKKVPYFSFDNIANKWLSKLHSGDTIKFSGSDGSQLTLFVQMRVLKKESQQDCQTLFTYDCTVNYYYDELYVVYKRIEDKSDRYDNLRMTMRIDSSVNKNNIPKGTVAKAALQGQFYGFNTSSDFPYLPFPDLYSISKFDTIDSYGTLYKNVVILKSGKNDVVIDRWFKYERTFSEVGFDMEYGFVYFKDIYGTIWKRTN